MASDDNWNLQGLSPEAREAAREAARRRGMPFEQWVQSAILDSARAGRGRSGPAENRAAGRWLDTEPGRRRRDDPSAAVHAMHDRVDDLRGQLERMAHRASDTAIPAPTTDSGRELAAALQLIEEKLAGLDVDERAHGYAEPIDRAHSDLPSDEDPAASEFERRIAAVDQALNSLNPGPAPSNPSDDPNLADEFTHGLDRAVADIRERQRILDAADNANPLKRQFASLSQRLSASDTRAAATPSGGATEVREQLRQITEELRSWRRSGSLQDALAVLREELSEIGSKLGEAAPRRALEALEAEVHTLAARLDDNRVHGADSSMLTSIEHGLAEVRESLRKYAPAEALAAFRDEVRALDRKLEWVEANADGGSLQQLQHSVAELREVATHAASGDALIALAEEVQRISDRLDHVTNPALGSELLSNLDRRFEALAAELGARADSAPISAADAADNLVTIVESLAAKMEQLELGHESSAALEAISGQLERLTDRIGSTDARLDHLEQMDRTFSELLDRVDGLRAEAVAAAERTAHEVAMQVVR
jgi:localization factor PodJL